MKQMQARQRVSKKRNVWKASMLKHKGKLKSLHANKEVRKQGTKLRNSELLREEKRKQCAREPAT